jgi:hypothetical protein
MAKEPEKMFERPETQLEDNQVYVYSKVRIVTDPNGEKFLRIDIPSKIQDSKLVVGKKACWTTLGELKGIISESGELGELKLV